MGHRADIECNAFLCLPEVNPSHYWTIDEEKQKKLEDKGWAVGSTEEFLKGQKPESIHERIATEAVQQISVPFPKIDKQWVHQVITNYSREIWDEQISLHESGLCEDECLLCRIPVCPKSKI